MNSWGDDRTKRLISGIGDLNALVNPNPKPVIKPYKEWMEERQLDDFHDWFDKELEGQTEFSIQDLFGAWKAGYEKAVNDE